MAIPKSQPITALTLTTGLNVLLGVWLFWSPWEFGAASTSNAWNSWIVGSIIATAALIRAIHPHGSRVLSVLNLALAVWIIGSPWIFGYVSQTSRFANSICVGVLVLILAGAGSFAFDDRANLHLT
jgi:hypothetical protein